MHIWFAFILVILATVLGLALLTEVSPAQAKFWQFASVYILVFAWMYGFSTFSGYVFRLTFFARGHRSDFLRSARRQGILLGILTAAALGLQGYGLLNYETGLLLLAIFLLIELYAQ